MDSDTVEEIKRHVGVVVEGLRSDMRVIAEGQQVLDRKVDGLAELVQLTYSEVTGRLTDHEARLTTLERRQT
jgi:hypothetical protein